ncbi:hypothetical protein HQN90_22125 [Paenibacillus alba]|nr:hypothetical protein [Paenibacillus alba]NQX68828.1 hypothetical protein [Paenibacillus alba]
MPKAGKRQEKKAEPAESAVSAMGKQQVLLEPAKKAVSGTKSREKAREEG